MIFYGLFMLSILLLFVGLIKPKWVLWWEKKELRNRKKVIVSYIIIGAVLYGLSNFTMPNDLKQKMKEAQIDHAQQSCLIQQNASDESFYI